MRSAGVASLAIGMSRITGLVREMLMARLFGAGQAFDAFLLGFRIPNLTRDLFAEGALSSAFVPVFSEYLTKRDKAEAVRLANLVGTALMIIVGLFCLVGTFAAPLLVNIFAPGFHDQPGKFELAVTMTRIMFPFLLLVTLAAQAMGVLNSINVFGVPATASTMFNIGSVTFGLVIGFLLGPLIGISKIEGMAYGVVLGGALQLFWQVPSLVRAGFIYRPAIDWSDPGLRRIMGTMGPAILGNAAVQINVLVNTNFASSLVDPLRGVNGPVSWLGYAFRFMQLPLGLFGVALATATLPSISRSAAAGDYDEFRRTLSKSLATVFLLTAPSSVGLFVLGQSIIGAIYEWGAFDLYDTRRTAEALSCFALGLLGYAGVKILTPAFYALGDSRTPMLVSLTSVLINMGAAYSLTHYTKLGHAGLALSTSLVALFTFLVQFLLLRARLGGIYGRKLVASLSKIAVAAMAMGLLVAGINEMLLREFGETKTTFFVNIAITIPLGLLAFYYMCKWLGVVELQPALDALLGPLRRRGLKH